MLNKYFLLNRIIKTLISNKFQVFLNKGCFDIAAKKEYKMLIKASFNVDGLSEEHALSLRAISYFISAYPLIVSVKTNRGFLDDKIIYSRFQIPVITPRMFDLLVRNEEIPLIEATKGKHLVSIDCKILKNKRKEMGLSLKELSRLVGISKKSLYEIENKRVTPSFETVEKLEKVLKVNLKQSFKLERPKPAYLKPKNNFQKRISKEFRRIGIENSCVYSAPFELVGKERYSLITRLSRDTDEIKRKYQTIKKISSFFSSRAIFITKNARETSINGIPVLLESELKEIESTREFNKLLSEKI